LVLSSLLGVLVGGTFAQHVSPHFIRRAAGSLFIVIGIWLWVGR
jgi:putative Ca2+/H+ antiporter (TMEM165/GDT1 family)